MSQFYYEPLQYGEEETNQLFGIVHDGLYVGAIVETKSWRTNAVSWKTYGCPEAMETLPKSHGGYLISFSHELIEIASTSMLSDAKRRFRAWFKEHGCSRPGKQQPPYRCYLQAEEYSDFYPTPDKLAGKMLSMVDFKHDKIHDVLEPSAGKGHLCDCLRRRVGDNWGLDIDCIEFNPDLRAILKDNGFHVVGDDFLKFRTSKCYDLILMNPPFSMGAQHLLHALQLMSMGGQIVCILNAETIRNPYSNVRKHLAAKLTQLSARIEFVQNAFLQAERKTDVEIAIVSVKIPPKEVKSCIVEHLQAAAASEGAEYTAPKELVGGDWVSILVSAYEKECQIGCALIREYGAMLPYITAPSSENAARETPLINIAVDGNAITADTLSSGINRYLQKLRLKYWRELFQRPELTRRMTSNLSNEYQQLVDQLQDYDFSEYNIRATLTDISKQLTSGVHDAIMNLFETFTTKYAYHSEFGANIHYYDGWTTNKAYKVGKRVIVPFYSAYYRYGSGELDVYQTGCFLRDLEQVLVYLDGGLPIVHTDMAAAVQMAHDSGSNKVQATYFEAILYKKGTCHIKFRADAMPLIDRLNIYAGREKNWLPPCYGKKHYADMDDKSQAIIDSFQGREAYERVLSDHAFYLDNTPGLLALEGEVSA